MRQNLTTREFIIKARQIHGDHFDYSRVIYIKSNSKIIIICPKHGEFLQTPNHHLNGEMCKDCALKNRIKLRALNTASFIAKANVIHNNKYNYSLVNYKNALTKVIIICPKHGEFLQTPNAHLSRKECKKCSCNIPDRIDFISKFNKIHNNFYNYDKFIYINSKTKGIIICPKHGKFYQSLNSHLHRHGCPKCSHHISKAEIDFLDYFGISYINRQIFIDPYKVDGYDKPTNTIYEFLGDYWHGNPEKYDLNSLHPKRKITYGKLYYDTILKFQNLIKMGYNVKYMWESDWKNFKKGKIFYPKIICQK